MGRFVLPLLAALLSLGVFASPAQAKETPAYLALGDSIAFGVGASQPGSQGYVALTFDALRRSERYEERGLELVNLSVPGATSADLLLPGGQVDRAIDEIKARVEDESSQDDNVEIISIDIGGNDLIALASGDSPCRVDPLGGGCQQRFQEMQTTVRTNLTEAAKRLTKAAPRADLTIVGLYNPYSGTGTSLEVPADIAVQQLNSVFAGVAGDPDIEAKTADVFDLFRGRAGTLIAADGLHPNDDGHAVIAEVLLAAIEGRAPDVPADLLGGASPTATGSAPAADPPAQSETSGNDNNDEIIVLLLIAIPAAFFSGGIITGAYLLARGRR